MSNKEEKAKWIIWWNIKQFSEILSSNDQKGRSGRLSSRTEAFLVGCRVKKGEGKWSLCHDNNVKGVEKYVQILVGSAKSENSWYIKNMVTFSLPVRGGKHSIDLAFSIGCLVL